MNGYCEINNRRERKLTEVDFTEGSASNLTAELVFAAYDALHVSKIPEQGEIEFGNLLQHETVERERMLVLACLVAFRQ